MDFAYSPHGETGGTMHLPSPTHHGYRIEGAHFSSSIQQLRRSLSRSPSKPSRFHLRTGKNDAPGSPLSPLALSRAFSPRAHKPASPISAHPESPFASQAPQTAKKKFTLRRAAPFRSSPRNRTTPKSPRRALVDSTDRGNASPFVSRPLFGDENIPTRKNSVDFWEEPDSMPIDDKPIKFGVARTQQSPPQPSPLKRRDVLMGFDSTSTETPNPKRRSLHSGMPSVPDFGALQQTPAPRAEEAQQTPEAFAGNIFATPVPVATPLSTAQSPFRRNSSFRRPGAQRNANNSPRPKTFMDGDFVKPGPAASMTRQQQRSSLDGFSFSSPISSESSFSRSTMSQPFFRGGGANPTRHPLSNAVTASASSSVAGDSPRDSPVPPTPGPRTSIFSKSLPLGVPRPMFPPESGEGTFETPFALRVAQNNPKSTGGLLLKKSRDANSDKGDLYQLPETPSKRHSFPPHVGAESPVNQSLRKSFQERIQDRQQESNSFNTPSAFRTSFGTSGLFGNSGSTTRQRRSSFLSMDGGDDDASVSPTANRSMIDSQSSADDMPPTPTKHGDGAGRRSKESSLRRRAIQRAPRGSIASDTFIAPNPTDTPVIDIATSNQQTFPRAGDSPHTPNEAPPAPLDASRLTISGQRRDSFGRSFGGGSFPPMTPTTPRDSTAWPGLGIAAIPIGLPKNDVDESLAARFEIVEKLKGAEGEFSQIFKVEQPIDQSLEHVTPTNQLRSQTWAVKKSKKPFIGEMDRKRKLREVQVLMALRNNDHVISYENHWEHAHHLYIQTEWCENGNLKDWLNKGRLDDFRIWKILLDLSLGLKFIHESGFIHLDLKPANILVDFGTNLKIADFGLASSWPAPKHIDGEGDRSYLAPEALQGRFDKPADVFALGIMLAEIAGDCEIPENGDSWQKLRSGDFVEVLPSLSFSKDESILSRDDRGDPLETSIDAIGALDQHLQNQRAIQLSERIEELAKAPAFMTDDQHPWAMDQMVRAMLHPNPDARPTAELVCLSYGCQWVAQRRRSGTMDYEGNFGPTEEIPDCGEPMITDNNIDFMDIS